ncbi:hypothetical protein HELRODRAFT_168577 [Helobdella robusta]|uniref:C-type lectin domain-containing protein n=1 Tax=Helobdella robusta TaxID=6412 RepID=T1F0R3_HELRO|nr:hypothetical protein HELRODRAFT_168577 [Helobdella robusta]ESO09572.1 hypothetical protein HELRODRAFT_168577 [Helobdella robusta]
MYPSYHRFSNVLDISLSEGQKFSSGLQNKNVTLDCEIHASHCFFQAKLDNKEQVNMLEDADKICKSRKPDSYLLEPYDESVHKAALSFANSIQNAVKNVYPINVVYSKAHDFMSIKRNRLASPMSKKGGPTVVYGTENYVYATIDEKNKRRWMFQTADHEQLHTVVCVKPAINGECSRIRPNKAVSLKIYKRHIVQNKKVTVQVNNNNFKNKNLHLENKNLENKSVHKKTSTSLSDEELNEIIQYLNTSKLIEPSVLKNDTYIRNIIKDNFSHSKDSLNKFLNKKANDSITLGYKKLAKIIKIKINKENGVSHHITFPAKFGDHFKNSTYTLLTWMKTVNMRSICRFIDLLIDPKQISNLDEKDVGVTAADMKVYETKTYPEIKKIVGHEGLRAIVNKICMKIQEVLSPLLRKQWDDLINKEVLEHFKNLDFQIIGEHILKDRRNILNFTEEHMRKLNLSEAKFKDYKTAFENLTSGIKSGLINVNAFIGHLKNGKILDWKSILVGKQDFLATTKDLSFKKIGQVYAAVENVDTITLQDVVKLGYNVTETQFGKVKEIFKKFDKVLKKHYINKANLVKRVYGDFFEKFAVIKDRKILGLNIKNSLKTIIENIIPEEAVRNNPFLISDDNLTAYGLSREDWNTVVQRVSDNAVRFLNDRPDDIAYTTIYDDQCLFVFHAVLSWYEGQSLCAEEKANLVVFDEVFPVSYFNDVELFALPDFKSFWVGSTRDVWAWKHNAKSMTWSTLSEYTAISGEKNYAYFQAGSSAFSWYVSNKWDPEAGKDSVICMTDQMVPPVKPDEKNNKKEKYALAHFQFTLIGGMSVMLTLSVATLKAKDIHLN